MRKMKMCKRLISQNQDQGVQLIQHVLDAARKGFIDIGSSVDALKAKNRYKYTGKGYYPPYETSRQR
jgi:hypothetical protein